MLRAVKRWWRSIRQRGGAARTQEDVRRLAFTSYDDYVAAQLKTNEVKRDRVWVLENELATLAAEIRRAVPNPRFGLCHGVRNGAEVKRLRELLGCEIQGTEISPSAADFQHVIQWDFHQVKPEWLGRCDFIYSNSLDHSYDPQVCLAAWLSCLAPGGRCFIHWSREHDHTDFGKNGSDCFQATRQGYRALIDAVGEFEAMIETDRQDARCLMICRAGKPAARAA